MIKITYLRFALATPAVLALLAWLFERSGFSSMLGIFLLGSIFIGGVPYVLTVIVLLAISCKARLDTFERWWFFSPFLMALMCCICALGITLYTGLSGGWHPGWITAMFGIGVIGGLYSLMVGYVYVLFAALIFVILKKFGLITGEPPPFSLDTM